jgi:hypothetical protein
VLLLVMVTGALGSFVHTATSFSDFVGNQKLSTNWVWWYILRPFIGMALAAIFYVAIRAGLLTGGGQAATINIFGVAALSGMVGMFAKQATDKLSEVFDTIFKVAPGEGDRQRKDGLVSPIPVPAVVPAVVLPVAAPVAAPIAAPVVAPARPAPVAKDDSGTNPAGGTNPAAAVVDDDDADGCEVAILEATPDEQLPAARGGVA